jgi:hypothetical protein
VLNSLAGSWEHVLGWYADSVNVPAEQGEAERPLLRLAASSGIRRDTPRSTSADSSAA